MSLTSTFRDNAVPPGALAGPGGAPAWAQTNAAPSDDEAADAARREREIENRELFDHGIVGRGYSINHQYASGQHGAHNRDQSRRQDGGAAQMQSMMMAASWGQQTTTMGGIEMTNDEALTGLRGITSDPEYWARWAVKNGYIKPGEEAAFIAAAMQEQAYREREANGETLSQAEKEHRQAIEGSFGGGLAQTVQAVNELSSARAADAELGKRVGEKNSDAEHAGSAAALAEDQPESGHHLADTDGPMLPPTNHLPAAVREDSPDIDNPREGLSPMLRYHQIW